MLHLEADARLAEVPGLSRHSLDALARSVELRRQQLEDDIRDYITRRQHDLRAYEQELLAHHRSMECLEDPENASAEAESGSAAAVASDHKQLAPEEKAKRTKHSRVQKREKELYGLVTPVFLPLLDARDASPKHEPKKKTPKSDQRVDVETRSRPKEHAIPAVEHGEQTKDGGKSRREHSAAMHDRAASEPSEMSKKPKRSSTSSSSAPSTTKKSALRQHSSTKPRRKRVSLVIDGHTVLPADTVAEPALTSPSSETTSASNSTASLDDMLVDPRLTRPEPHIHTEHTEHTGEAVHHSLPLPMSNHIHSPTKPLIDNTPSSLTIETIRSPITASYNIPPRPQPASLPSPDLAVSDPTSPADASASAAHDADDQAFNTYVGGLRGSGADDVDQAGSYGYPSSLGASYLESYMQSRPLRVRMEAADRAGLEGGEREEMLVGRGGEEDEMEMEEDGKGKGSSRHGVGDEDEEGDFMGEMDMDMDGI